MTYEPAQRLIEAMMVTLELPVDLTERATTTVVGRADRADTGMAVCYRVGPAAIIWTDPAVEDRFAALASTSVGVSPEQFTSFASDAGFSHMADAAMRVLSSHSLERPERLDGYIHERLTSDDVERVRTLTEGCTEDDVDEAGLDELDDFDEAAINILSPSVADDASDAGVPVAYASASPWEWDEVFADIGVLVHPEHRRRGLGQWVVAHTTADLLEAGRLPFYRHQMSNAGSASLADGLGFEMVTWLQAYGPAD